MSAQHEPVANNRGPAEPLHGRQEGRLDLRLARVGAATRPLRCAVTPPLQLSRVRYDDPARPGMAALTLVHLGGVLDGDRYTIEVALEPGAAAQITTAAATQVYRMPRGDAAQAVELRLAEDSLLEWLPEPLILFGGSRFSQATSVTLAPGARLALLDVLSPGRLARGEVYQFQRYAARLEVWAPGGRLLLAEYAELEPERRALGLPGVLSDTPVAGSLYLLGDGVDAERGAAQVNERDDRRLAAAALPNRAGLLIRALGQAPGPVARRLRALWRELEL